MHTVKMKAYVVHLVLIANVQLVLGRIGFKKDQSTTNVDFPPKVRRGTGSSGIPLGHLRPLGWQRSPEGMVSESTTVPSPKQFYEENVVELMPSVFRGATANTPAATQWAKDDFLKKEFGDLSIHVIKGKSKVAEKMKFRKFLLEYQYENWYLTTSIPQPMMKYLTIPKCIKCGFTKQLLEYELWMSAGGTSSPLHSHADHHFHCLLTGRKDFIVIHPDMKSKLGIKEKASHPGAGVSAIDVEMVNMYKFKELSTVAWKWATLKPGDCMFIPAKYYHQVRSYGRSISWTMLWAPLLSTDFSDCDGKDVDKSLGLNDAAPVWTYVDADRQLTNIKLNAASLRHHLTLMLREEDSLAFETFKDFYDEVMSETDDHPSVNEIWSLIDRKNEGNVTRELLIAMEDTLLNRISSILNSPHQNIHDEL